MNKIVHAIPASMKLKASYKVKDDNEKNIPSIKSGINSFLVM